jgi:hypothetical protein
MGEVCSCNRHHDDAWPSNALESAVKISKPEPLLAIKNIAVGTYSTGGSG